MSRAHWEIVELPPVTSAQLVALVETLAVLDQPQDRPNVVREQRVRDEPADLQPQADQHGHDAVQDDVVAVVVDDDLTVAEALEQRGGVAVTVVLVVVEATLREHGPVLADVLEEA